jgi:hypothetical protein
MTHEHRKKADQALLLALACGASVESAARQCRLSERTIYRRLSDATFRRELAKMRSDMVQRSAGMLTAAALESVKTLITLQAATSPPGVRLGAARAVLEIGVKLREAADLEDRVAGLEDRLQGKAPLRLTGARES